MRNITLAISNLLMPTGIDMNNKEGKEFIKALKFFQRIGFRVVYSADQLNCYTNAITLVIDSDVDTYKFINVLSLSISPKYIVKMYRQFNTIYCKNVLKAFIEAVHELLKDINVNLKIRWGTSDEETFAMNFVANVKDFYKKATIVHPAGIRNTLYQLSRSTNYESIVYMFITMIKKTITDMGYQTDYVELTRCFTCKYCKFDDTFQPSCERCALSIPLEEAKLHTDAFIDDDHIYTHDIVNEYLANDCDIFKRR